MFDDEDEDFLENKLNEDLDQFESHLKGNLIGFLDSDRLEAVIDHYLVNSQYSKALSAAELGVYHFQYNSIFHLRKAQAMAGMGLLKDAIELLNIIEKANDSNTEIFLTKAALFSQLRDPKNAIKYYKLAIEICDLEDRDEIYMDIAIEYQNMSQFKEAIEILIEAIKINNQNEGALYEIAYCYDQLGDYTTAIKCYSDFIDENPYSFTAWYNLGNAFYKLENFEKAIWAFEYSILINSEFGPAFFNIANAYLSEEKYHKAIEYFHESLKLDGDDASTLCYLGEAHEQLNELDLAKHFYRRSIELAPLHSEAWLGLGIIEDLLGNTKEGIVMIHKALEYDQDNAGIHHVLAGAYEKLEEFDLVNHHYETSLLMDETDEECLSDYIEYLAENSPIEALKVLQEFMCKHTSNPIASVLEVNLYWILGEKEQAIILFTACLNEDSVKAKTIFEINPELLDDQDFLNLSAD